jgi:LacI family transcriptional regulator
VYVAEPWVSRQNVALVLPSLDSEDMTRILSGVKKGMAEGSARLLVQAADFDFDEEWDLLRGLDPSFVAGAVIYPPPVKSYVDSLRELRRRGVPYVLVNTAFAALDVDAVTTDAVKMGAMAMEHLLSRGHRRIGIVGDTGDCLSATEREEGAEQALHEAGLSLATLPRVNVSAVDLNGREPWANGQAAAERLLADHPDLTAVVGMNGYIALGVMRAIALRGLRVPKDISVLSLSDTMVLGAMIPGVTAVAQACEEIGRLAAQRLNAILSGRSEPPQWTRLPPALVQRDSVADLTGGAA